MDNPPVGPLVLEMEEPILPFRRLDPSSLMGSVYGTIGPGHHNALLIRPPWVVRPQYRLPACSDATSR